MKLFATTLIKPLLLVIFLFLSACQSIDVRGQYVSDSVIEEINNKKPNQDAIIDLIGTPTYVPKYSPDNWYYIQRSLKKRAWFDPKVVEQRIVKVTFTTKGQFVSIELLSNIHDEHIAADSKYTKTRGTDQNSIQKFVKNIGRFNKTTDSKKRRGKKKN